MLREYKISNWFLLGLLSWLGIITLRKNGIIIPFLNAYFTDLITIPMYCYLIQYVMNKILGLHWKPNLKFIITSIVYLSILFEVLCPSISDKFTGDIFDVVAYLLGGLGYYFFQINLQKSKLFF